MEMLKKIKFTIRSYINYETYLTLKTFFKKGKGVKKAISNESYVISLTSIPSRLSKVHVVVESLLSQTFKPEHIILWLSEYDRDGKKVIDRNTLPSLLKKQTSRGLTICFCEDIRSYRKLLPTIKKFPKSHIVTADDDIIYPNNWLENLVMAHSKNPDCIICYRGVKITYKNCNELKPYIQWPEFTEAYKASSLLFPQGGEGTIYPANIFNDELFNKNVFLDICLTADDVWFKAMSLVNQKKCLKITKEHQDFLRVRGSQGQDTLCYLNNTLGKNDIQINKVFRKYNLIEYLKNIE